MFLKFSFGCDRDAASIDTDPRILKRVSELGRGGPLKNWSWSNLVRKSQEKSGKIQEISRARTCNNPGAAFCCQAEWHQREAHGHSLGAWSTLIKLHLPWFNKLNWLWAVTQPDRAYFSLPPKRQSASSLVLSGQNCMEVWSKTHLT